MIHQLLQLTRPLIIFDTETTGTDTKTDRIVELGFQLWTAEGLQKEYRTLVNPGVPIPKAASDIHGIRDIHVQACRTCNPVTSEVYTACACDVPKRWPAFKDLAANLAKGFSDCDFGGKNPRFDLKITAAEMARCNQPWNYAGARIIDADRLEAWLNKRSLSHLYRKYTGNKLDGAHGALADVRASTVVLSAQLKQQLTQNEDEAVPLPRDLDALHALQWPGWIDAEGLFVFIDGVPCFGRWGKYAGKPMKDVEVGYYDFILKNDFSVEVKALAGKAKLKQFPVQA